jgi:transcriptional regulator with XRE-family HTH domain
MERQTIRALRRARGMTQQRLAEAMGCNVMSVYHWESGRNEPSARQLRSLSQVFGVPMEGIAFEKDAARTDHAKEGEHE